MKELERTYRDLMQWMVAHPEATLRHRQEIQERLVKKRCVYGDATMQTTLMPLFLKPRSLELIRTVSEGVDRLMDKVVDLYFKEEVVRQTFPAHFEVPHHWIEADPGYKKATLLNRLDVLFDGKSLKFIEFNTDNPGGRGWIDTIEDIFARHPMYKDLMPFRAPGQDRMIDRLQLQTVLEAWKDFGGSGTPRVAMASFPGLSSRGDDETIRDYFIENGVEANVIDPRDLELSGGKLRSGGVTFDVVMRCMTSRFFLRYPRELRDFVRGTLEGAACVVNSFKATLGSEKSILSFLSNPLNHKWFTAEEIALIQEHIPWTRKFDETVTLSPDGDEIAIKSYLTSNRERLVIKPTTGAGGYGVMVGRTTDPLEWLATIEANIGSPYWIAQEYVEIPSVKLPVVKENKILLESRFLNLSPYVFGGHFAGILGRVSSQDVINVSAGGGVIPVFALADGL